jgi:CheY-like chemotaxis protein
MSTQISAPDLSHARPPLALLVDRDVDTRGMYAGACAAPPGRSRRPSTVLKRWRKPGPAPEVVVTDTRLAGISGYDLCRLLRRDLATHEVPVVVVTAAVYKNDVTRAEEAGADTSSSSRVRPRTCSAAVSGPGRALSGVAHAVRGDSKQTGERARPIRGLLERSRQSTQAHVESRAIPVRHGHAADSAPALICPQCDQPLRYRRSHVGGVSERHLEQWDYFECGGGCGTFQYRERTRKLRKVV